MTQTPKVTKFKILVAGASNTGKTRFIQTAAFGEKWLSDEAWAQRLEELRIANPMSPYNSDYATMYVDDDLLMQMIVLPDDPNYNLKKVASQGALGHLILIDSSDSQSISKAEKIIEFLKIYPDIPRLIVANKQDVSDALTIEQIRSQLELEPNLPIVPCNAKSQESTHRVLKDLISQILEKMSDD